MAETMLKEIVALDRAELIGAGFHGAASNGAATHSALVEGAADQAKSALLCSRIYTLRRLHVGSEGDAVILRGRVESFYHKQLAQELVRAALDGTEVINAISVVYGRDRSPAAAS